MWRVLWCSGLLYCLAVLTKRHIFSYPGTDGT
jgi:hypothetical protein